MEKVCMYFFVCAQKYIYIKCKIQMCVYLFFAYVCGTHVWVYHVWKHAHMCVPRCVYACMWRPEVDDVSPLTLLHRTYRCRVSHLNSEFSDLAVLASQLALHIPYHLLRTEISGGLLHLLSVAVDTGL